MNPRDFFFLKSNFESLMDQGFVFYATDNGVRIGVDTKHKNWSGLGLVEGNKLSHEVSSVEEAMAWCEGFKCAALYFSIAHDQRSRREVNG